MSDGEDAPATESHVAWAVPSINDEARTWDVTPDLFVVFDMDGRFVRASPSWRATLGRAPEDLHGTSLFDLIHSDDMDATLGALDDLRGDDPVLRLENRYRHADGSYRWLSWVAVPEGEGIFASARNVTTDKARLAALTERDRLWAASRDLWVVVGGDGLYREVNHAWTRQLGYDRADLVGTPFDARTHPDDLAAGAAAFAALLEGRELTGLPLRIRARAGDYRRYEWRAYKEGDVVFGLGRDVEERTARAAELVTTEQALRQSQKLELIGQLTGGVAHDFNNLLMAVQSSVALVIERVPEDDEKTRELLGNALTGVARGATLTQRMLAFARKQELAPASTDIAGLIGGMRDLLARSLGPGIEVVTDFAPDVPPALADANQLEMAILNLAVNARDAMNGQGRLTIAVRAVARGGGEALPPGAYIEIAVRDEGEGMDPATLARATEPFFTTKGVGKGTGLGLPMIHGLARQSGGDFALTSEVGVGTVARLLLPISGDAVTAPHAPSSAPPRSPPPALRGRSGYSQWTTTCSSSWARSECSKRWGTRSCRQARVPRRWTRWRTARSTSS